MSHLNRAIQLNRANGNTFKYYEDKHREEVYALENGTHCKVCGKQDDTLINGRCIDCDYDIKQELCDE